MKACNHCNQITVRNQLLLQLGFKTEETKKSKMGKTV